MRCLITNDQILNLVKNIQDETEETVKGLVSLWQEKNNKSIEEYPSIKELINFRDTIRNSSENTHEVSTKEDKRPYLNKDNESFSSSVTTISEMEKVDRYFDPKTRKDRVNLISRLFSNEVTKALEEIKQNLQERIDESEDPLKAQELQSELESIDREDTIRLISPSGIFKRVYNIFNSYVSDSEENKIKVELNIINSKKASIKLSEERKLEIAKNNVKYKNEAYTKIVENFKALAEEASSNLLITEGIKIYPQSSAIKMTYTENEYNEENDGNNEVKDMEEVFKDGWMTDYKNVSSNSSLSKEVRKIINQIAKVDKNGKVEKDDLGFVRYLDPTYVHAVLIDKLRNMNTADDMMPALAKLSKTKPWVSKLIDTLNKDNSLFSKFYQDFRKDFISYYIQKKKLLPDGTYKIETISINKPEGIYYLLESWRENYESGNILDKDSIYDNKGNILEDKAKIGLNIIEDLNNKFSNLNTQERLNLIENEDIFSKILKVLHMIGIDSSSNEIKNSLFNIKTVEGIEFTDPIMILLQSMNVIFSGISKGGLNKETSKDLLEVKKDLINTYSSAYSTIAHSIAIITEDAIESSVRENSKSYYSHIPPSYLPKLIRQLKDINESPEEFKRYIENQFKKYDWFYKDGSWRNDWLKQLEESAEIRKGLDHKLLLNHDKMEYSDWDSLDHLLILLNEYWGVPDNKSNIKWAWYHVPILSDSESAEFIKFRRYTNNMEYDKEGKMISYKDIILSKMVDLVMQEYDRIMLVRNRHNEFLKGNPEIIKIENFDIKSDKEGKLISLGGAEFKFLPKLNNIKFSNGKSFIDTLFELSQNESGEVLRNTILNTLEDIMEEEFEETFEKWADIGILDENDKGKYLYLPQNTQGKYNYRMINTLTEVKDLLGDSWDISMENILVKLKNNKNINDKIASKVFDKIKDLLRNNNSINENQINSIFNNLIIKNNAKEALREYFYNSKFATSQLIQLTTTDLAFYKNIDDFQKRFKQVHSPALRLNTKAFYNGELIGREWEKTIYLKDYEIKSSILKDIEEVIKDRHQKGKLSDYDAASILSKFGYSNYTMNGKEYTKIGNVSIKTSLINVADAQAYRSLSSYRAILGMSGQWNENMERAFNNFKEGKWDIKDFNIVWQTKKPFVYTQVEKDSGIEGYSGIKTPINNKNSEFLLLAAHTILSNPINRSNKLSVINKFMEDNQIDVVQFESSVKVGKQGIIDLSDVNSMSEIENRLNESVFNNGIENPNVVHKISYEDYGIQVATPEHLVDTVQAIGTQIRKLITADISDEAIINIGKTKLTKAQWLEMYNAVNTENILQSYLKVENMFKDPKKIESLLLEEVKSSPMYGVELMRACTLDENGEFNIPLFDPIQSLRIQSLLNSVIKKEITKQKTRGGALIQVSNYGLSDKLNIVFEGEGENKRIKYFECYMPAYSREFFEPLIKEGSHELDINQLPEGLRRAIGYRIPTEDKYSMVPLRIKGFLPQQNGSAIMLPSDITTISGSDFDIDKLYIMLPEYRKVKYDYRQALNDFKAENSIIEELSKIFSNSEIIETIEEEDQEFKEWFRENKHKYILDKPKFEKIEYNFSKSPSENSLKARNNLIIDLMWGILTNKDTTHKILNPGGFDNQKKSDRIIKILNSYDEKRLRKVLSLKEGNIMDKLMDLDISQLEGLLDKVKEEKDPLSPLTQMILHQQNMTGAKLIGIYANHNANHALMQHTKLGLNTEHGSFTLNGKTLTSLHDITNNSNEFISRNNAGFLAASVDNVKDPVLAGLNQNVFTADATMLLSRLGYNSIEIGLLMNQPIILEITRKFFRESRNGKSKNQIIDEVIDKYRNIANVITPLSYDNYKSNNFLIEELAQNIMLAKEANSITEKHQTNNFDVLEFHKKQIAIGYLFKRIMKTATSLSELVQATKADTTNGASGPTIADTEIKISKVKDFINSLSNFNFPLVNADIITPNIDYTNVEELRTKLLESKLPFLQAFYTLGLSYNEKLFNKYFPYFNKSFRDVVESIKGVSKIGRLNVKTINNIYNDLLTYIMSKSKFFGNDEKFSSYDKREKFIKEFPSHFKKIVSENDDIKNLEFIKRLKVIPSNQNTPVESLVFKNVGNLTDVLKERYMRDWTSLLYMNNPEAQRLAFSLFKYNYYRNGFAFGPNSFIHLAPVALRKHINEYIDILRDTLKNEDDYTDFINQYIYNHLDNRSLVPEIPGDSSIKFIDENNNVKDEITVTITPQSSFKEREIIKEVIEENPENSIYEFLPYIGVKIENNFHYYRLIEENEDNASYKKINQLGIKNSYIEYEYGKDVEEITSVFNNVNIKEEYSNDIKPIIEDNNQYKDYLSSLEKDFLDQAYREQYGNTPNIVNTEKEGFNIDPNENYKDANNDEIC